MQDMLSRRAFEKHHNAVVFDPNERSCFNKNNIDTIVSVADPPVCLELKFSWSMSHSLARKTGLAALAP